MEEEKTKQDNGCLEGCVGCGCLIAIIWFIFAAVSWGWHIHWLFGLLILLFLLSLL